MPRNPLAAGRKAPTFRLPDQDGREVALDDLSGRWVVLFFYPRDDTPGWTLEAREFTGELAEFEALGAVVLGVSPDPPERHCRFRDKHDLAVTLLSDTDGDTMRSYGALGGLLALGMKALGVTRSTVLIDPNGNVAKVWPKVRARGHAAEVRAALEELQDA